MKTFKDLSNKYPESSDGKKPQLNFKVINSKQSLWIVNGLKELLI